MLKRIARRTYYQGMARLIGWQAIGTHDLEDVFVVGFPKSGNTWFQYLAAGLMTGIDANRVSDFLVQDLVPDVHAQGIYRRYYSPMFFKTHEMPNPKYRRVIYLLRDGRDAMVSYYHHLAALRGQVVDWATLIRDAPDLPARWHKHVEAWTANPHGAELLLIRYEDLKTDCIKELKRVCLFLGVETDEPRLARVANAASFDQMRKHEKQQGWNDPNWPKDKPFVRRGKVGSFRDEMPAETLALFVSEAGQTLLKHGYST